MATDSTCHYDIVKQSIDLSAQKSSRPHAPLSVRRNPAITTSPTHSNPAADAPPSGTGGAGGTVTESVMVTESIDVLVYGNSPL